MFGSSLPASPDAADRRLMPSPSMNLENRAWLGRITAGWKKPELPLDVVRRYWRDVHSPAIARRDGLWEYRHYQFDGVNADVFPAREGLETSCPDDAQLMWLSDVRYDSQAGLDAFALSPPDKAVLASLLGDIDLIVLRSTTYRAVEDNAWTYIEETRSLPQGAPTSPHFGLFFRSSGTEGTFREGMKALAVQWSAVAGVRRLRLALLDAPDAEAERKAGYPIKTHPQEQQYQAWIDLVVDDEAVMTRLAESGGEILKSHVRALHAYPVAACYTSNFAGQPTLVGLRGYPALDAIRALGATNQVDPALMRWMYDRDSGGESLA